MAASGEPREGEPGQAVRFLDCAVISPGAEQRGQDVQQALSEAVAAMDQPMSKAAQASSLALKDLASRGREFSNSELKRGASHAADRGRFSR